MSCVPTVWALTAWPMNQTMIVSLLRCLKSIKGPRFIGEAAFSMNSSLCTATWLERLGIRGSKSFLQFLGSSFTSIQRSGSRWNIDLITSRKGSLVSIAAEHLKYTEIERLWCDCNSENWDRNSNASPTVLFSWELFVNLNFNCK